LKYCYPRRATKYVGEPQFARHWSVTCRQRQLSRLGSFRFLFASHIVQVYRSLREQLNITYFTEK